MGRAEIRKYSAKNTIKAKRNIADSSAQNGNYSGFFRSYKWQRVLPRIVRKYSERKRLIVCRLYTKFVLFQARNSRICQSSAGTVLIEIRLISLRKPRELVVFLSKSKSPFGALGSSKKHSVRQISRWENLTQFASKLPDFVPREQRFRG